MKFWDPEAGREVRELKAHAREIVGMTFSPDGQLLATIGADEKVRLWDVATRMKRFEFRTTYRSQARMLRRASFSPDSRLFAWGSEANSVTVWDLVTDRKKLTLDGHEDLVFSVAFSSTGDRLVSVSWDLTAKVWDLTAGGRELFSVHGHASAAWAVEFSPDGSLLAVAGRRRGPGREALRRADWRAESTPWTATPPGSAAWRSTRTAGASPRAASTRPCASGNWTGAAR